MKTTGGRMIVKVPMGVGPIRLGLQVDSWIDVDGDVVQLKGYEALGDFIVHAPPLCEYPFVVSHVQTGARVPNSQGRTKDQAVRNAVKSMDRVGIEKVKESIDKAVAALKPDGESI